MASLSRSSIASRDGNDRLARRVTSIVKRLLRIISGQALRRPAGPVPASRGSLYGIDGALKPQRKFVKTRLANRRNARRRPVLSRICCHVSLPCLDGGNFLT